MIPYSSRIVQSIFPSATWNAPDGKVCLTFDDGPHPKATPAILDTLDSYSVKGTFFFLGRNVERHSDLAREAADRGHSIGNHAYDHSLLLFHSHRYVVNQVGLTARCILETTGKSPDLFRPPYGYFRPTLLQPLQSIGHRLVMWNLDPGDWRERSAAAVSSTITRKLKPGSIVLLHDNGLTADKIQDILKGVLDSQLPQYHFCPLLL